MKFQSQRKIKIKDSIFGNIKLTNRFGCLEDEETSMFTQENQNKIRCGSIFAIGSKNLFKVRKVRVLNELRKRQCPEGDPIGSSITSGCKRERNRLSCFNTVNRFEVLIDNPEDNLVNLIERLSILTTAKKSLKRCKTNLRKIKE